MMILINNKKKINWVLIKINMKKIQNKIKMKFWHKEKKNKKIQSMMNSILIKLSEFKISLEEDKTIKRLYYKM